MLSGGERSIFKDMLIVSSLKILYEIHGHLILEEFQPKCNIRIHCYIVMFDVLIRKLDDHGILMKF